MMLAEHLWLRRSPASGTAPAAAAAVSEAADCNSAAAAAAARWEIKFSLRT